MEIIGKAISKTAGLLLNKARDKTAEKLKDGDVTDQKLRDLIIRKIEDIKTKLDGLARKDLLASAEFLERGTLCLNQVFEKTFIDRSRTAAERAAGTPQVEGGDITDGAQAVSFVSEGIKNFELTDLNESAKKSLADATDRFRLAREKATDAFSNKTLSTCDHILALKIQLMATILERVD